MFAVTAFCIHYLPLHTTLEDQIEPVFAIVWKSVLFKQIQLFQQELI